MRLSYVTTTLGFVAVALACVAVGQAGDLVALAHGVTPSGPLGMPPAP